jgi:hypothetical protein
MRLQHRLRIAGCFNREGFSMPIKPSLLALAAALASAAPAHADMMFNRVATFAVAKNLPKDAPPKTATSSEIISASEDGNMLVYSDSPYGGIGFIDITDPKAPKAGGSLKMDGEPTSVVIVGGKVLVAVNTSESNANPSGQLRVVDIATKATEASCDLGGQPDSVAVSKDKAWLAVAIENERDENLNDGAIPQMPAGTLKIVALKDGAPDCATIRTIDLTGLADVAPEDPEPEFVAFNDAGEIAVTLQENNHIAIVDAASGRIVAHFSAGSVALANIDTKKDGALSFTGKVEAASREPDAVKWLDDDRLAVANEGDWKGGTRGFTVFSKKGEVLYESGPSLEHEVARAGHYPDKRNKKGIEPEGLEFAAFGDDKLLFVAAERASVVGVYKIGNGDPEFLQHLPSGIGPEGLVAIPQRNLLVTANETDLGEDGLARSHVMIYERSEAPAVYPMIVSTDDETGLPIGWGALSGLYADPEKSGTLYAVSDSFYRNAPAIFTVDTGKTPALITAKTIVTRDSVPAQKLDIEGITGDGEGGFWLANEGNAAKLVPHALLHVDHKGAIKEEIGFPPELLANEFRFGLEGVTAIGNGDDLTLVMAVQREWKDDPKGQVKLLAYKPKLKEWSAVRYPLDKPEGGWMGLSEITAHDGKLYIIERDNQIGDLARTKKLYAVSLDAFKPASLAGDLPVVEKTLVRDLLPELKAATSGYVLDKVEGFAIDGQGNAFVVTDNDGVDDSSGETVFLRLGNIAAVN